MRFTLSSSALSTKLGILSKVINTKNSLSILDSYLFEIRGGQLIITASDNANMMRCYVALSDYEGEGAFCIPNRIIQAAVKELPEQPLTFEVSSPDNSVKVIYQNGSYRVAGQNADDYPNLQPIENDVTEISIPASTLASNIQRTMFATANDELRMVMNGLYFDLREDSLNIVASDGHKMVRNMIFSCKTTNPSSFILPKKPAGLLRSVLDLNGRNSFMPSY